MIYGKTEKQVAAALKAAGIPVGKVTPGNECVDAEIALKGNEDLTVQVGYDYAVVSLWVEEKEVFYMSKTVKTVEALVQQVNSYLEKQQELSVYANQEG